MATIRIQLPEKDHSQTFALAGERITIGRLPNNTIQISDRSVSGRHAVFILEGDHYRLHDVNSTNGTYVNGQRVTDFHLTEGCTIGFGTMECEFDATPSATDENAELLPSRTELENLKAENATLKNRVEVLDGEVASLKFLKSSEGADTALVAEVASLKEQLFEKETQLTKLKEELSVAKREQEVLENALQSAKAGPAAAIPAASGIGAWKSPASAPAPAAPAATPVPAASPTIRATPAPAVPAAATPKPATPLATPAPTAAAVPLPATPVASPTGAKPFAMPTPGLKPAVPAAPGAPVAKVPTPSAPSAAPVAKAGPVQPPPPGAIGGPKPKSPLPISPKPAVAAVPSAKPAAVPQVPRPVAATPTAKPVAAAAPGIPKPALKPMPVAKPAAAPQPAGPSGTQKLSE